MNTIASLAGNFIFGRKLTNTVKLLKKEGMKDTDYLSNTLAGQNDAHWKWRFRMVQSIAKKLDFSKFGIRGLYLIGSTKEGTSGPASDIDLLIHVEEQPGNRSELKTWIEGWSFCLSDINYTRTGYETDGLVDAHYITDEDIKNKTCYGAMIGLVNNSAKPIKVTGDA